jgi:hypothetical protein
MNNASYDGAVLKDLAKLLHSIQPRSQAIHLGQLYKKAGIENNKLQRAVFDSLVRGKIVEFVVKLSEHSNDFRWVPAVCHYLGGCR